MYFEVTVLQKQKKKKSSFISYTLFSTKPERNTEDSFDVLHMC